MEVHKCLECGNRIKGRTDKRFCNDQCRNSYHNRLKSDINAMVRRVNKQLRHNRRIMEKLVPSNPGKITIPKSRLTDEGFNFNYHTHTYTTKNGHTYIFCYEYGYLPLDNNVYMLVKREESSL